MSTSNIEDILKNSLSIMKQFDWLIDSYVLDFYTAEHWNKLPMTWKSVFEKIEPEILTDLFKTRFDPSADRIVWPLSILCLRSLIQKLSISRDCHVFDEKRKCLPEPMCYFHPKLRNLFRKRIKSKKQHEIERMAALCAKTAVDCDVKYVLDFGSGLGHLSRVLGYGYGLNVCCLEQQKELTEEAKKIDESLQGTAQKFLDYEDIKRLRRPVHLNIKLTKSTDVASLLNKISESFGIANDERDSFRFGIVGLHPCGDLAAILLNVYLNCREAKFLNLVGCCHMKLSESSFPLSSFLKNHNRCHLTYEAKEISCHNQEVYVQRLTALDYKHLMVHSYRAALEKIICKHWPELKRSGLRSIKYYAELTFFDYCLKATSHLNIDIPVSDVFSSSVQNDLKHWKNVVIFYTLRLLFAPLVESVILYDRMLCVLERNFSVQLEAIFDPFISSRNLIMTAKKS
ncbi:Methyltransferase-like protein 25B [Pseudolycoriella hygida]|uniref:Methyltransferase-like protein 25B n=1 Tax=Pseudolycoriella hygida TaxID=35572 RepID=A0A9Q0RV46_9DIPT|nr:Methyltransferase-like protein 25B [Pseudolycoriella hygida]